MKKVVNLILVISLFVSLFATGGVYASGTLAINTPADGAGVDAGLINFQVSATDVASLEFYLDGELFASFNTAEEDGTYDAAAYVDVGNREFEAVAVYSDGTSESALSDFAAVQAVALPVNEGVFTNEQSFDDMGDSYAEMTSDAELISAFSQNYGWSLSGTGVPLMQRVAGASGKDGDYAVRIIPYASSGGCSAVLKIDEWTEAVSSGTIMLEYDFQITPVANKNIQMSMRGIPFYKYSMTDTDATGKVFATDFITSDGEWVHVAMEYDVGTKKCNLSLNGIPYWTNQNGSNVGSSSNTLAQFFMQSYLWSGANSVAKAYGAHLTIDNFKIALKGENVCVDDLGYVIASVANSGDNVPANAESVQIMLGADIGSVEKIYASFDGNNVEITEYSYADNTITAAIPEDVKSGDKLKITVQTSGITENISAIYTICDEIQAGCEVIVPEGGRLVEENNAVTLSAKAQLAQNVEFYIDGTQVAAVSEAGANSTYTVEVNTASLPYGKHTVKAVANLADGTTIEDSAKLQLVKKVVYAVNDGVSTDVQTFDNLSDDYNSATADATLVQNFCDTYGWTVTGTDVNIQRNKGASGAAGDYAIKINPTTKSSNAVLQLTNWDTQVTNGTIHLEFDCASSLMHKNGALVTMAGIPFRNVQMLKGNATNGYGNVHQTEATVNSDEWVHLEYEYDIDTGLCSLAINGTPYWTNEKGQSVAAEYDRNLDKLAFKMYYDGDTSSMAATYRRFMLDNFRISMYDYTDIVRSSYFFGATAYDTTGNVLAGAEKLRLILGGTAGNANADTVKFYVNDAETILPEITANGTALIMTLPEGLKANDKIRVELSEDFTVSGEALGKKLVSEYEISPNGNTTPTVTVKSTEFADDKSSVTVMFESENITGAAADGNCYVIASYTGNKLTDLMFEKVDFEAGKIRSEKSLSLSNGITDVKVFAWDASCKPLMTVLPFEM